MTDNPFDEGGGDGSFPVDAQGNKTNPAGRGIDNSIRGLLESLGVPGVLSQAPPLPTRGDGSIAAPTGIQAGPPLGIPVPPITPVQSEPLPVLGQGPTEDTVGQQVPPASPSIPPSVVPPGIPQSGNPETIGLDLQNGPSNSLMEAIIQLLSGQQNQRRDNVFGRGVGGA